MKINVLTGMGKKDRVSITLARLQQLDCVVALGDVVGTIRLLRSIQSVDFPTQDRPLERPASFQSLLRGKGPWEPASIRQSDCVRQNGIVQPHASELPF